MTIPNDQQRESANDKGEVIDLTFYCGYYTYTNAEGQVVVSYVGQSNTVASGDVLGRVPLFPTHSLTYKDNLLVLRQGNANDGPVMLTIPDHLLGVLGAYFCRLQNFEGQLELYRLKIKMEALALGGIDEEIPF
jgi:hypothetical protein